MPLGLSRFRFAPARALAAYADLAGRHSPARALFGSRLFWAVLALKLVAGSLLASHYPRDLFVPFVNYYAESGFSNPWRHFADLGRLNSFPYPPVMLYALAAPRWLASPFLPGGTDTVTWGHLLALRLPLAACDVLIAVLLAVWFPHRVRRVLWAYWCSPIAFYVLYWHGQLDVIPTALLLVSFHFLRRREFWAFTITLGTALACKTHLFVALPFLALYLGRQIGWRRTAVLSGLALFVFLLWLAPYLPDPAFRQMVFGTSETGRAVRFLVPLGDQGLALVLAPLALFVLAFRFEAYPKHNWDLLMLYLGIAFCVFITLAPPRPAYYLWSLPFLVYYACKSADLRLLAWHVYAVAYFTYFWLGPESDLFDAWRLVAPGVTEWAAPADAVKDWLGAENWLSLINLAFTAMVAAMGGILIQMYREGVRSNAVYRLRTTPTLIGLAGDSGAGKDVFCGLLTDVLGPDKTLMICGDDYHRWPRGHEMWRVYTHLDMRANDLHRQAEHTVAIAQGRAIVKGTYDHHTGQFTREEWVDPRQFVVFSGLHTLAVEAQRQLFDLTIFVDPDERLREAWKVERDCKERGYTPQQVLDKMRERAADRDKFIRPQRDLAELVVRFRPAGDAKGLDLGKPVALEVLASTTFSFVRLAEELRSVPGPTVEHDPLVDGQRQALVLRGPISAEQVREVAEAAIPSLEEITAAPAYADGLNGLLQLVLLACLSDKLRWAKPKE